MNKKYYQYFHHAKTTIIDSWYISFQGSLLSTDSFCEVIITVFKKKERKIISSNLKKERKLHPGKAGCPQPAVPCWAPLDFKDDSHKICSNPKKAPCGKTYWSYWRVSPQWPWTGSSAASISAPLRAVEHAHLSCHTGTHFLHAPTWHFQNYVFIDTIGWI